MLEDEGKVDLHRIKQENHVHSESNQRGCTATLDGSINPTNESGRVDALH